MTVRIGNKVVISNYRLIVPTDERVSLDLVYRGARIAIQLIFTTNKDTPDRSGLKVEDSNGAALITFYNWRRGTTGASKEPVGIYRLDDGHTIEFVAAGERIGENHLVDIQFQSAEKSP